MHYGYRIVEDMIDGLQNWMGEKGFATIEDFRGLSAPKVTDWNHLNLNFKIVAHIHDEKCIGCELCYIACWDGAHQCIHLDAAHSTPPAIEAASRSRISVTPIPKLDRGVVSDVPQRTHSACRRAPVRRLQSLRAGVSVEAALRWNAWKITCLARPGRLALRTGANGQSS